MEYAPAKHLLTPIRGTMDDFFYADWNMNLYRGCSHGCIYCDSRSLCYHLDRFDTIRPKQDALALLESELRGKRRPGVIAMGAMSDPYNPLEKELCLTRGALELIRRYRFGASFTTKSALCARDAALLQEISLHAPVRVQMTVTCAEDELCLRVEPRVSPTSERLAAVRALSAAGVYTGVWINPVLPFITDSEENITGVVRAAAEAGAKFAVCFFGMTLRSGNREYYFDALEREFPGIRARYLTAFGNAYVCEAPDSQRLFAAFTAACERHGLAWRFSDINRQTMARQNTQLSLWG